MTGKHDEARKKQLEFYSLRAELLGQRLQDSSQKNKDWVFRPPGSDDPEEWKGIARYMYIERTYAWHIEREANLSRGLGPYWCPECEEKQPGWRAELCYTCSWDSYLKNEALACAKRMSGIRNGEAKEGKYAKAVS